MTTHSSILAWKTACTEEPGRLQSMGSQRVRHDWATSLSHDSKAMLKNLQARLQEYMNQELPDVQARFRKGTGIRDQIANICWIIKKKNKGIKKNIYFCIINYAKYLTRWIITNCGKFLKRWEYQTTLPVFWETCKQDKKQQLDLDMEQQTGSKSGKECIKAVYCHCAYLTYMQSTSCEMLGWKTHKLESRLLGEISTTSDMRMTLFLWQKAKRN